MTDKNKTEQNLPFSKSEIHGYVELEDWQANVNNGSKLIYIQLRQTSERGRENYGAVCLPLDSNNDRGSDCRKTLL